MKYFTKEELEDITNQLLVEPTRETLKKLNEKYNGITEVVEPLVKEDVSTNAVPPVMMTIPSATTEAQLVEPIEKTIEEQTQVVTPIPNFNIPNMNMEGQVNKNINVAEVSSFELPKLETPVFNNQNNEPVAFSGNLWNTNKPEASNLMQTTDNFNNIPNQESKNEVPVTGTPFFATNPETVNNPIPVQGPTMFGQMQQNYM